MQTRPNVRDVTRRVTGRRPDRAGVRRRAAWRAGILAYAWATAACRGDTTGPAYLAQAVPLAVQPPYALWWSLVEQCSGLQADMGTVRWAMLPNTQVLAGDLQDGVVGSWSPANNQITLAASSVLAGNIVRHEMLHALLGPAYRGHPRDYFGTRCGGVVACDAVECAPEVATVPEPPTDAQEVAPSALTLAVLATPAALPRDSNGGYFVVTVTATNPLTTPIWVRLSDDPRAVESLGFGFDLDAYSATQTVPGARVPFWPGQTRRLSFDLNTEGAGGTSLGPGTYTLHGRFGAAATPTAVVNVTP